VPINGEGKNAPAVFAAYLDNVSDRFCAIARKFSLQFQRALAGLALNRLKRLNFSALIVGNEVTIDKHIKKVAHGRSHRELRQFSMEMLVVPGSGSIGTSSPIGEVIPY